jgi:hypothetical protein
MATAANLVPFDSNGNSDVFVRRVAPTPASSDPVANLGGPYVGWATSAAAPAFIRLDGSGSRDPRGRALTARWDFGDGTPETTAPLVTTHAYSAPGRYTASLRVSAGANTSAAAQTEVEVLPPLPREQLSSRSCVAAGGALWLEGTALGANAALVSGGWDLTAGPLSPAPAELALPWGLVHVATELPGLAFSAQVPVPAALDAGSYRAAVDGGATSSFEVPCAVASNLPPLANAGGPAYRGTAGQPVALDGTASSDPEGATLTYRWSFGDGQTGTGVSPAHTWVNPGEYLVTLVVNDGVFDSATTAGTRSFAQVSIDAGAPPVDGGAPPNDGGAPASDAGVEPPTPPRGCGCSSGALALAGFALALFTRRRARLVCVAAR